MENRDDQRELTRTDVVHNALVNIAGAAERAMQHWQRVVVLSEDEALLAMDSALVEICRGLDDIYQLSGESESEQRER